MREVSVEELQEILDESNLDEIICVVDGERRCVVMSLQIFQSLQGLATFVEFYSGIPEAIEKLVKQYEISDLRFALKAFLETLDDR